MRKTLRCLVFTVGSMFSLGAVAQVSVGATTYPTLKAAFDAINAGTHTGAVTINVSGNTSETATAVLNASGTGSASYTSVAINATAPAIISSNLAGATIRLDGADNVNLNGNSVLQIVNTNSTGPVIQLINDATNNIIRNATITGNTASYSGTATAPTINSGVIAFGTGTTTGNDGNQIDNCDINGNNQAICLVYSNGIPLSPTPPDNSGFNSGNTLKNSRLYNFINTTIAGANAVYLASSNTDWTIQNNSIYLTAAVSTPMQFLFRGILIVPSFTNDFHTVTGNYVGGSAPSAAGTMTVSASSTNAIGVIGIDLETGGTGNIASNNTVKNISLSYSASAGSFANAGIFGFIGGYNGTTTFSGNEVSNFTVANNNGFLNFSAIHVNGRVTAAATVTPTFNVTGNIINNITANSGGAAGDVNLHGIRLESSSSASLTSTSTSNPTFNVSSNTITNISVPFAGTTATFIRGIGTVTTQGTSATALLYPRANITNNTIHGFSTSSTLANYGSGVCTGIHFAGSSAAGNTYVQDISENTIYDLSATNSGDAGAVVIGILASTGLHDIARNRIYDLKNASTSSGATAPGIVGITVRNATGTSRTFNNFISLGGGVTQAVQIFGFLQNFNAAGPVNVYHNSIYIDGTAASGDKRSAALVRGTELFATGIATPIDVKNNILYNARTGGGGSHYAIVNSNATPATGYTSDANVLYTVNPFTLVLWGSTNNDLATYKTNSGDVNSRTVTVNFANTTTGDLHLTGSSNGDNNLGAAPVPGITTDYDSTTRSSTRVYIGADEASLVLPVELLAFTGYKAGDVNQLQWTTASETNNSGFELQRSADGKRFTTIAFIPTAAADGNSSSPVEYRYSDRIPLAGTGYYRLKQVDNDGHFTYTSITVMIRREMKGLTITAAYPNPVHDVVNLAISSPVTSRSTITVTDLSGRIAKRVNTTVEAGDNNIAVNLSHLPAGTYLVTVISGEYTRSLRIIKN
ncbi:MAG TPA: T9SS type A sorting domain-containing protein [Chitinophagaceae bacterium]